MAESLSLPEGSKSERYAALAGQLVALVADEPDPIANQANVCAALRESFGFFWVGFYRVEGDTLVLGPFQGPLACTRIPRGKGVCGSAWERGETLVVPDVDAFPGHIACSSRSRSEIVIPVRNAGGPVTHILDVDSDRLNDFDEEDRQGLEGLMVAVAERI